MVAALSEQDLATARAELAAGTAVTVWFTKAAVGVPAGGSAKVVSVEEPPEGDFIQVRPAGSRDTMFCAPNELTRTRPPRKRVTKPAATSPATPPAVRSAAPAAAPARAPDPAPAPVPRAARVPEPRPEPAAEPAPAPEPEHARPRAAAPGRAPARPATVTVTLAATAEGEWSVEVVVGKKRSVRPTPVPAADVAKAARALPAEVAEAIESSLEAARHRQVERVQRLRAELEAAQRALQDLSG